MNDKAHKIQIFKFGLYGFLKNLMFFEPYLIIFFTNTNGLSLGLVGVLYSIREIIVYVFEIPSGVIADRYGKKTELVFTFSFYIISFVIFFFSHAFGYFVIGMIFFGLGEAFRSGTHKAMIMEYLDRNDIAAKKSQIYGKTRSFSLFGSMFMSLLAIVFVIWLPEIRYLFLISTIPFFLDLIMILTYPDYLNQKREAKFNLKSFLRQNYESIKYALTNRKVNKLLLNSSAFQAGFKSIKDYIQPIIISISAGIIIISKFSSDDNMKIYIGLIYAFLYLASAFASKNAHHFHKTKESKSFVNLMWLLTGSALIILSFFLNSLLVIFIVFFILYILQNLRRPIMIELIGNATDSSKRASVLSVESQSKSLLLAIFAPIIGFLADYSMQLMFILFGVVMIIIFLISQTGKQNLETE